MLKGELPKNEKHLVAPASVLIGVHVKYCRDEAANVLDLDDLGMQVYNGGGLMSQQGFLERLVRATTEKQPEVLEVAGRGGGTVSRLDGGLDGHMLASSAGKRVTGVSGG